MQGNNRTEPNNNPSSGNPKTCDSGFLINRRQFLQTTGATGMFGSTIPAEATNSTGTRTTVYVGSADSTLYAVNAADGSEKWAFTEAKGPIFSSPTVVDGVVYVGSNDGNLYAVNAADGSEKWVFTEARGQIISSPTVVDGVVYVGSGDGNLYAVNADGGTQKWSFDRSTGTILSSPAVDGEVVYVGSIEGDHTLYAVNVTDGTQRWAFTTPDVGLDSSPTVVGGVVYVGESDPGTGPLYAINADDGSKKWTFTEVGSVSISSPTVVNGIVYIGSNNLYAVNAADGSEKWTFTETKGHIVSSPTVVDGVVYVGSNDGNLYAVDINSGNRKWRFGEPSDRVFSSPTVFNGVVYFGAHDNTLYALDTDGGGKIWQFTKPTESVGSSPTVVRHPVGGNSVGSRVRLRTLGHHSTGSSPDPRIVGRVLHPIGEPLADIPVTALQQSRGNIPADKTDEDGRFELELGIEAGEQYTVIANEGNGVDEYTEVKRSVDVEGPTEVEITLESRMVELVASRRGTTVYSPVTLQLGKPERSPGRDNAIDYEWTMTVLNAPASGVDLLRERSDTYPHTTLRPEATGTYEIAVEVTAPEEGFEGDIEAGKLAGVDVIDINVRARPITIGDNETSVHELVEQYSPRYFFTEGEQLFPTRYEAFADNATLGDKSPDLEYIDAPSLLSLGNPGQVNPETISNRRLDDVYDPSEESNRLTLRNSSTEQVKRYQEAYPPTIHAHVTRDVTFPRDPDTTYTAVTYWTFYLLDNKDVKEPARFAKIAKHASDTESVTILIDDEGEPKWIGNAKHFSGDYMKWQKKIDSQPGSQTLRIYPARGSHASYLVDTSSYESDVPLQPRWLERFRDTVKPPVEEVQDLTGTSEAWELDDPYDLVVLTGDEEWGDFAGKFDSPDLDPLGFREGGQVPQQRGERWNDVGEWMEDRMLFEREVISAFPPEEEEFEGKFEGDYFSPEAETEDDRPTPRFTVRATSTSPKPHEFYIRVQFTLFDGDEPRKTETRVQSLSLAWDQRAQPVDFPLGDLNVGNFTHITAKYDFFTYAPEVADELDRLISETKERSLTTKKDKSVIFSGEIKG